MIKCGVFDSLGVTRSSLMSCYESIIDSEHEKLRNNISGQLDMFSMATETVSSSYSYPLLEEYPLKELLQMEKESSGLYFSGHMIDSYSDHVLAISPDRISDILDDLSEDGDDADVKKDTSRSVYSDKASVSIVGIINSKRTKLNKKGETMAFVTVEDKYAEIEVIAFAKQYNKLSDILVVDCPIHITGTVSVEDDRVRIMLSNAEVLISNSDYGKLTSSTMSQEPKLYIKLPSLSDSRINLIYRIAMLNRGTTKIVLYDSSTKKYVAMRDLGVNPGENVLNRLKNVFSSENVILK